MDRQHDKEAGRQGDGTETVPEKAAQQLVGTEQGKMSQDGTARTDAGRAMLPDMTDKGFVIDDDVMKELKSDPVVWHNFCRLPELYKRVRIDTIQIKKRQPELFGKRLDKFIENTRNGVMYGEWNDNGRLLM